MGNSMKFDVIIGNPPYQMYTGGGKEGNVMSDMPLYDRFVLESIKLNPEYACMIIPSKWMSGGRPVLNEFRRIMVESKRIKKIITFERSRDVFPGIEIAGGVMYFLWGAGYSSQLVDVCNARISDNVISGDIVVRDIGEYRYNDIDGYGQYLIISDNKSQTILKKVMRLGEPKLNERVLQNIPFGLSSNYEDSEMCTAEKPVKVVCSGNRVTYTSNNKITKNSDIIHTYKVCAGRISSEHAGVADDGVRANVITKPFICGPNEVCSMTYMVLSSFENKKLAENMITYINTKFFRFLVHAAMSGQSIAPRQYAFVPVQDYSKRWNDSELYLKYKLSEEEIKYIEYRIKEWE